MRLFLANVGGFVLRIKFCQPLKQCGKFFLVAKTQSIKAFVCVSVALDKGVYRRHIKSVGGVCQSVKVNVEFFCKVRATFKAVHNAVKTLFYAFYAESVPFCKGNKSVGKTFSAV